MAKIALAFGLAALGGIAGAFLGPAGSLAGAKIGIEVGFGLGGLLGGILFPGKLPSGPRLQDLQVTSGAAGSPIPFGYGTNRVAGQLIWSSGIIEHQYTQSSKKGGTAQQTTYFYTISFAVAFGEGPGTISKIWFDNKIAYDGTAVFMPVISARAIGGGQAQYFSHLNPAIGEQVTVVGTIPVGTDGSGNPSGGFDEVAGVIAVGSIGGTPFFTMSNSTAVGQAQFGTAGATTTGGTTITKLSEVGSLVTAKTTLNPIVGSQVLIIDIPANLHGNAYAGYFQVVSSTPTFFTYYNGNSPNLFTIGDDTGTVFCGYAVPAQPRYAPPVIYPGSELQGADPTIQGAVGVSQCSAFRPLIYAVWNGLPLADFGNRLPNVRAQVTYEINQSAPGWGAFDVGAGTQAAQTTQILAGGITPKFPYEIAVMSWHRNNGGVGSDPGTPSGWTQMGVGSDTYIQIQPTQQQVAATVNIPSDWWTAAMALFQFGGGSSLSATATQVQVKSNVVTLNVANSFIAGTYVSLSGFHNANFLNGQSPFQIITATATQITFAFTTGDYGPAGDSGSVVWFPYKYTTGLSSGGLTTGSYSVGNVNKGDLILVVFSSSNGVGVTITDSQGNGGGPPLNSIPTYLSVSGNEAGKSDTQLLYAFAGATGSLTLTNTISGVASGAGIQTFVLPGGGLSPSAVLPTFPQIVTDLCTRTGLLTTDIDVTQLASLTPPVGYMIGRPSTGAAALKPLATAFFFDAVETGGVIKFVTRGNATSSLAIPESDLGLMKDNHKLIEIVNQAQDLPREFQVSFIDPAIDYQMNHSRKRRNFRIVKTKNQVVYELPMTISSTTARQIAEKALFVSYLERKPFQINLWKPLYLLYDPTDVINFTYEGLSFTGRILTSSIGQDFTTQLNLVNENSSSYLSSVIGNSGNYNSPGPNYLPISVLFLMDIPLLTDSDANPSNGSGYYFGISTFDLSHWPGAQLFKSSDNVNFSQTDQSGVPCPFGYVGANGASPLGSVAAMGILEGLNGGNYLKWSQDFEKSAVWTLGGTNPPTITPDVVAAPDGPAGALGSISGDQISFGALANSSVSQSYATGAALGGTTWTAAVWLYALAATTVQLRLDSNGFTGTAVACSVQTGWNRFMVTQAFAAGNTDQTITFRILNGLAGAQNVYAWGASLLPQITPGKYTYTQANIVALSSVISPFDFDTVNSLTIIMSEGTAPAGTSDLNVYNGTNAALVGQEILEFGNVVQNADGSFTLSRLLRGRRGSEVFCNSHVAGESVIFLIPSDGGVVRHPVTLDQLNLLLYYKAVTAGGDITAINSQQFTNTGNDLKPYAVCQVTGSRDMSNNLTVNWVRRTRIGGAWAENIGTVPLSETTESYDVDILNAAGTVVRTFSALSTPTVTYTAAQQITDFGSTQSAVTMNIYQNSSLVGRGFKKQVTE